MLYLFHAYLFLLAQLQRIRFFPLAAGYPLLAYQMAHFRQVFRAGHQLQDIQRVFRIHNPPGDARPHIGYQRPDPVTGRRLQTLRILAGQQQAVTQ